MSICLFQTKVKLYLIVFFIDFTNSLLFFLLDCKTEVDENGDLSSFFQEQQLHDETFPISLSLLDEIGKHDFIYALFLIMLDQR